MNGPLGDCVTLLSTRRGKSKGASSHVFVTGENHATRDKSNEIETAKGSFPLQVLVRRISGDSHFPPSRQLFFFCEQL